MIKKSYSILLFLIVLLFNQSYSQSDGGFSPVIPYKTTFSPAFGEDIIINNNPSQDQRNVVICSAPNGNCYAAYTYVTGNMGAITILKSEDSGLTWNILFDYPSNVDFNYYADIDLLALGNPNVNLYLAMCIHDSLNNTQHSSVFVVDGNTGDPKDVILNESFGYTKHIRLASDYPNPAIGTDPYSLAAIYSIRLVNDSIILSISNNGGISMDFRQGIYCTSKYLDKVDISYGRSGSYPEGRYFITWEEKENQYSPSGHIFTSHTISDYNFPFSSTLCLDSMNAGTINNLRCPVIASQNSSYDNNNQSLSEIIVCENFNQGNQDYDLLGFCNNNSISNENFESFTIVSKVQPSISYNLYDSTFMMTYFDPISKRLPYLTKDYNLNDPQSWTIISEGYNDSPDLSNPNPLIKMNYTSFKGMNTWMGTASNGYSLALFDSPTHYYTFSDPYKEGSLIFSRVHPNPACGLVYIDFYLPFSSKVIITVFTQLGQQKGLTHEDSFTKGLNVQMVDISEFSPGLYYYKIETAYGQNTGKIVVKK